MNHDSSRNDDLRAFEARLCALSPSLPPAEQQQLLYQCAFAAGQNVAKRTLRRWQGATAALTVLLVGLTIPIARGPSSVAQLPAAQAAQNRLIEQPEAEAMSSMREPRAIAISLDAWQRKPSPIASLDKELSQFAQLTPRQRSLSVGALQRHILEP